MFFDLASIHARKGDWLIVLRPVGLESATPRRLAKVLKQLLRIGGIRCIEARELPDEKQKESPVTPSEISNFKSFTSEI